MSGVGVRLAAAGLAAALVFACTAKMDEGRETSSRDVAIGEVPLDARKTILATADGKRIRELEEKVIDGKTVYEAAWIADGGEVELMVAADGKVLLTKGAADDEDVNAPIAAHGYDVDKKNLGPVSANPYFPLEPGRKVHLAAGAEAVVVSVLDETYTVDGVETRVIEERETEDGELVEISRNYFAADKTTNDVYYFGEHVDWYEDGKIVGHGGTWIAGEDGAKFGLIMPGERAVGAQFYLENSPGVAMETVKIVDVDATLKTPLKTFAGLVHCRELDLLDGGMGSKFYARGIGMVGDAELLAVKIEEPAR